MTVVPPNPCPPEMFSGRHKEREAILNALSQVKDYGQVIMISGARGSGKSSLLDWLEYEVQRDGGGLGSPAAKKKFFETPGMVLVSYGELLKDVQSHTKFGWFRKIVQNESVQKGLSSLINIVRDYTTPIDPVGVAARAGEKIIEHIPSRPVGHDQLLMAFLDVFKKLSEQLETEDGCLVILLDEAQWSSDIDYLLLKDLVRNIPSSIALIFAYRLEDATLPKYSEIRRELERYGHLEIQLKGMQSQCIKELLKNRYNLEVDEVTAGYLQVNIGDPLCLIACLNLLQQKGLALSIENIHANMSEAIENPAEVIYQCLDEKHADWANRLCILNQPMPLTIMACMLQYHPGRVIRLQDELKASYVFTQIEKGLYEYAHPSLREYRKNQLPEEDAVAFHALAAKCFTGNIDKLPDKLYALLSLAEHAFWGGDYQEALILNLRLGDEFYDHYNYSYALQLMLRAKESAELLDDRDGMAVAYHHIGMIFQVLFESSKALEYYTQSLAIVREIGNRAGEAGTLHQIGSLHLMMNKSSEALEYYNQSLEISHELGDQVAMVGTLFQIGTVHLSTNQYDEALKCFNQSLAMSRKIGYHPGEGKSLHQIGALYKKIGHTETALEYYHQSLVISQELGDRGDEATTLRHIGAVYQILNCPDNALEFYRQSLVISQEIGKQDDEAGALYRIGLLYQRTGKPDEALKWYNQSLAISQERGNRSGEATNIAQIGVLFREMSKFDESVHHLGKALSIALQDQMSMSFQTLLHLAENLDQMGEEQFTNAWRDAFYGEEPPLKTIREAKRLFEEATDPK